MGFPRRTSSLKSGPDIVFSVAIYIIGVDGKIIYRSVGADAEILAAVIEQQDFFMSHLSLTLSTCKLKSPVF
jgi:hypothetical protein